MHRTLLCSDLQCSSSGSYVHSHQHMAIITHLMAVMALWPMPLPHLLASEETPILMKMKPSLFAQTLVSCLILRLHASASLLV